MQFLTTARGKLKRWATRCLGQTIRAAGQETMLRALMTSMGSPNCAILAGKPALVLGKTRTEMCLFMNWHEVSWSNKAVTHIRVTLAFVKHDLLK